MKNIVIIGAGPAGLTAAYELLSKYPGEYNVTILEESEFIGGISMTVRHNGNRMDIGGHRFFSKEKTVLEWWLNVLSQQTGKSRDQIILETPMIDPPLSITENVRSDGGDPETDDEVMLVRNRVSRIYYSDKFFDYPISLKWQTIKNIGFFGMIGCGFSYMKTCFHKRPETSLENFYINRFGKKLYSMFFETYTEKVWGRHPSKISADWGSQRVKGISVKEVMKNAFSKIFGSKKKKRAVQTSLIESFWYPKYGPGQLWETVADRVRAMGGNIIMNKKAVEVGDNYVKTADGGTYNGDFVISSMPIKDLVGAMPDVPEKVREVAAGLPYRDFVTVGLLLDKLKLKNLTKIKTLGNIVPDCWIYVQDGHVKLGRIQIFNNWSPYMVSDPEHTVWVGMEYFCNEGDDFWNMTDEEIRAFAIEEMRAVGAISGADDVKDFHRHRVKKAYPAYFDTYAEMSTVQDYLITRENLLCVGRNGQHRYNNMDHSMMTAFEAVKIITGENSDRAALWNVNTEKEYHEKSK